MRREENDKPQLFAPDLIREINFQPGRHSADPEGHVCIAPPGEVKLLHYKFLGLDYYTGRLSALRQGLRPADITSGWGRKYLWSIQQKPEHFRKVTEAAVEIT